MIISTNLQIKETEHRILICDPQYNGMVRKPMSCHCLLKIQMDESILRFESKDDRPGKEFILLLPEEASLHRPRGLELHLLRLKWEDC